jgi:hypothetical protein
MHLEGSRVLMMYCEKIGFGERVGEDVVGCIRMEKRWKEFEGLF